MFQALYNSLSGLFSYSQALDVVSNNVANMNTPGFRGSNTFFENVGQGDGVAISGQGINTTPGSLTQTGTPTDLALTGNGYFILQDASGNLYYTRAGQFVFNAAGLLTDSVTGYDVMAIDSSGNLSTINETKYQTLPGVATTTINMAGNILPGTSSTATPPVYTPSPDVTVPDVTFFDASGTQHTLTVTISDNSQTPPNVAGDFGVTVMDGSTTVGTGEISFDTATGEINAAQNSVTANVTIDGKVQSIALNFGTGFGSNATTSMGPAQGTTATSSSVAGTDADGSAPLGISSLSFDANGVMQLQYSATQTVSGPQIALASFNSNDALQMIGGRLVAGSSVDQRTLGHAGAGDFGTITGGSLELSNVDLTQEFANMIIIQRGYQASSHVMTVANQMIEDLYNSGGGGG